MYSVPMLLGALVLGAAIGILCAYAIHFRRADVDRAALRRALASSSDWWWRTDPNLQVVEAESGRGSPAGLDPGSLRGRAPWQLGDGAPSFGARGICKMKPFLEAHSKHLVCLITALRAKVTLP